MLGPGSDDKLFSDIALAHKLTLVPPSYLPESAHKLTSPLWPPHISPQSLSTP